MSSIERIRIDDDVAVLTEQVRALRELGQRAQVHDWHIYDLSIRWGTALAGRLRRLAYYHDRGLLDDDAERRVAAVCDELRSVADLVERFDLARPDLPA
ncbi:MULTISPECIES: hypothetical protein [Mycobacteriaceae]|uniref:Uncharacterized protein n=4 Tax=Mycobacteriaceae TaxID=1762 RepID=F5Z2X6_MYCSD|nr:MULTISPECIES: hypothetical protein [Mycobacteriaceae]AEF37091.1 conserved hypothetical protein [Mycolicibacter sinensis]OQZ99675.1 hypothetical protein BST10_01670 [Mycolicibacter algericus DSM 45454]RAU99445.1 hypothetical protein DQP56_10970 [Mycolicibacter senuensis]BBX13894.1 hypothetical protein MNVM_29750 [Mycobacterium novum]GFG86170.1 hypothetical protein MALGJ_28460 [Mycolicibacter algericus]